MKRMFDATRLTEFVIKAGLIAGLAATLLMPTTVRLLGNEVSSGAMRPLPMNTQAGRETLPLPPIPYLETMPWLQQPRGERGFKIDTLLAPGFEPVVPALVQRFDRDPALSHQQTELKDLRWNG